MRSDVEHVHDWEDPSRWQHIRRPSAKISRSGEPEQMETLSCMAYARIFKDPALQQSFCSDTALAQVLEEARSNEIRAAFGNMCDITELKLVKNSRQFRPR